MTTLFAIMNLLPAILAAVQAVETAIPMPGAGKAKLDLVMGMVTDVYAADRQIQKALPSDLLVGIVTSTIARVVAAFNALGLFNKAK